MGTDGIDGNSLAAGELISPTTIEFLKRKKIEISKYTTKHDSYNLLLRFTLIFLLDTPVENFNDIYLYIRK